ncbi:MAG: hypothetical protein GF334_09370 [Candidatus Altiarchaeales archaeon]|nr:hypothetical protein [Candidatus Altiarchaeales archaeon]
MDERDVLDQARNIEREGIAFYGRQAQETENQYAKLFFERMVQEEEDHLKLLESSAEALKKDVEMDFELGELPQVNVFPQEARKIGDTYLEALQAALELEKRSMTAYADASEKTSNPQIKRVYDYLVEFEGIHMERIQSEIDFIENTAGSSELG